MNVLLLSPATNNIGETYTLGEYAKELIREGNKCRFIAPELGKRYLQSMGFSPDDILVCPRIHNQKDTNRNHTVFIDFIRESKPQFAIVADWHEYHGPGISNNNSYSLEWLGDDIKLGSFDHFGYAPNGMAAELFMNGEKKEKIIPPLPDRFSFVIRPCPQHKNNLQQKGSTYYWGMDRTRSRGLYNTVPADNKTIKILLPIGFWQESGINRITQKCGLNIDYYNQIFIPVIIDALLHIGHKFQLYVVAYGNKKLTQTKIGNVDITYMPPLSHRKFNIYLDCCDILLTDNFISSNIGKTLTRNIISIALWNSFEVNALIKKIQQYPEHLSTLLYSMVQRNLLSPFISFPLGLNLLPEINNDKNPFLSCFIFQELFDRDGLIAALEKVIHSFEKRANITQAKDQYMENNYKLFTASEILNNAALR